MAASDIARPRGLRTTESSPLPQGPRDGFAATMAPWSRLERARCLTRARCAFRLAYMNWGSPSSPGTPFDHPSGQPGSQVVDLIRGFAPPPRDGFAFIWKGSHGLV